jgi:drug/metabolite transporter (DMT)-like permease
MTTKVNKNLEEQVTYLQQELSDLSNELYSQQKEIKELKKEITDLNKRIIEMDGEIASGAIKEKKTTSLLILMSADNNSKGIVLILIAMSLFSMQDALIKFIFEQSALYEIFFGRYLVAAIVLFIYLSFKGQKVSLKTHYPLLTFIRVLLHFIAFSTFFISITYMQLATANALFFSCPFFVSIFAKFFLKEFIGIRSWSAIAFGFMGVLIVLNPNFSNFEYRNLLPVLSALFYAASMTITKYTSDKDDVNTQLYYFYLIALILCGIIYFFMGNGQFNST